MTPITLFLSYYRYALRSRHAARIGSIVYDHDLPPLLWSLREVYWDYFPSRFHRWYDKNIKGKYDDEGRPL